MEHTQLWREAQLQVEVKTVNQLQSDVGLSLLAQRLPSWRDQNCLGICSRVKQQAQMLKTPHIDMLWLPLREISPPNPNLLQSDQNLSLKRSIRWKNIYITANIICGYFLRTARQFHSLCMLGFGFVASLAIIRVIRNHGKFKVSFAISKWMDLIVLGARS